MTTTPPEQAPASGPGQAFKARRIAESFGPEAERYDRARPRYPDALIRRIVAASPGREFLDVGCGTGIVAGQLEAAGATVTGVEADAAMAEFARRQGIRAEVAKFEDWDPAGRTFDAVVAGMAWHWVDPVAGAAKAAHVLRPGGRLAVFWYVFEPPPGLREALNQAYRRVLPPGAMPAGAMPGLDAYSAFFATAAGGIRQAGLFSEPEQWRFDWDRRYTRDEWLDVVPTFGGHSTLPPAAREELMARIGVVLDAAGGSFTMRYPTVAVTATRA